MTCTNNNNCNNANPASNVIREKCGVGQSGCTWDGNMDNLVLEPIYVQKIYDAALFNLQGISYAQDLSFTPQLPCGSTVTGINYINITKYFDPNNIACPKNLKIDPETSLQGATFVQKNGEDVMVVGPDGRRSEKILYIDTSCCDSIGRGTPVFGSQNVTISGLVRIDMEVRYTDPDCCGHHNTQILTAYAPISAPGGNGDLILTNFFELSIPSVFDGAFLPRFTELTNASFAGRIMTNNLSRDIVVCPDGTVTANMIISVCVTCEKKIVMPAQLCVLSTGYTQLSPDSGMICTSFPSLFPMSIDENSINNCNRPIFRNNPQGCL